MSSVEYSEQPSGDLTAQARIRNSAVALFAAEGFQRANVRDIAADAGVSPGLVLHHFGSKAGLRDACDEFVLATLLRRARNDATVAGVKETMGEYFANPAETHLQVRYMTRAIDENSPVADKFVEAMVGESEEILRAGIADGSIRPVADLRAMAVLIVLNSMSILTMAPSVARALGEEALNPVVMQRLAGPALELYAHGLYTDDSLLSSIRDTLADLDTDQKELDTDQKEKGNGK